MRKMKIQRCSVRTLPDEVILYNILMKLPVKSIIRFKSVCKTWRSRISSDSYFIKLHLSRAIQEDKPSLILLNLNKLYYLNDYDSLSSESHNPLCINNYRFLSLRPKIDLVGSCNGLVCFTCGNEGEDERIYLWNPSTDEYKLVPKIPPIEDVCDDAILPIIKWQRCGYGFGYDSKLDDYKVMMIAALTTSPSYVFSIALLYSLSSDSWEFMDPIPYVIRLSPGVLLNGALHWMMMTLRPAQPPKINGDVIVSFDMVHEIFKEVPTPKVFYGKFRSKFVKMGVLWDCLCICDCTSQVHSDVWMMQEYGVGTSWSKMFSITTKDIGFIPSIRSMMPLECLDDGYVMLEANTNQLILYDPKHKKTTITRLIDSDDFTARNCLAISYVGSLVSLGSKTYLKQKSQKTIWSLWE